MEKCEGERMWLEKALDIMTAKLGRERRVGDTVNSFPSDRVDSPAICFPYITIASLLVELTLLLYALPILQ